MNLQATILANEGQILFPVAELIRKLYFTGFLFYRVYSLLIFLKLHRGLCFVLSCHWAAETSEKFEIILSFSKIVEFVYLNCFDINKYEPTGVQWYKLSNYFCYTLFIFGAVNVRSSETTPRVVVIEWIEVKELYGFCVLPWKLEELLLQQWKHSKYTYARCLNCLCFINYLPALSNAAYKSFMEIQVELQIRSCLWNICNAFVPRWPGENFQLQLAGDVLL